MDITQKTDEELIEGVKSGGMDSFRILYDRYKLKIYNYLYHLLESREQAEDCAHDLFIQLFKKASLYSPKAKFSSWLYCMAKILAFDALRKNKTRRARALDQPVDSSEDSVLLGELLPDPGPGPEKAAESKEIAGMVRESIAKLNEKDKQIILLCDMQGLSHQEVSEILGDSINTITVRLYRARRRLAEILKKEGLL